MEPAVEPALSDNFNPFDTKSPLGAMGVPAFIYEPLLEYDELQVNQYYPWLAQSWSFSTSGLTLTFTLRAGVTWDDGSALSAADVAYTFNLLKANPALAGGIPIVSAVAANPTTVTLTLSQPGYAYLYDIARVPIVKAGFALGHNPATFVVKKPDGTGPYELARPGDMTRKLLVLTAHPKYWQPGSPSVARLVFPTYEDAAAAQTALLAGKLDWAGNFMPNVKIAFEKKNRSLNHFWGPPVDAVALVPNLGHYPLDHLAVREAVSVSTGRAALSRVVTGGIDPPATTSSGLVTPLDNSYLSPAQVNDVDAQPELILAQRIMTAAGFHMGTGGYWQDAAGHVVGFTISTTAGTVYSSTAVALATQLRAAGFDVTTEALTTAQWDNALASGNFDSTISSGAAGPTPYYTFQEWLSPAPTATPAGTGAHQAATTQVAGYLAQYRDNPSDSNQARQAITSLAGYVSSQLPVVPLLYGVAWGEFSTRHASGWPNDSNPYEPASPSAPFDEYTVLQLTAVG